MLDIRYSEGCGYELPVGRWERQKEDTSQYTKPRVNRTAERLEFEIERISSELEKCFDYSDWGAEDVRGPDLINAI